MNKKLFLWSLKVVSLASVMVAAKPFDSVVSIGDSLSDAGTYYQDVNDLLVDDFSQDYNSTARFTVNPGFTHPMYLAEKFGLESSPNIYNNFSPTPDIFLGGPNYAQGAAGVVAVYPPLEPYVDLEALPLVDQLSAYLANTRGKISPNAIVTVLGGDNDIQNGFPNLPSNEYIITAAEGLSDIVQKLEQAGSKHTIAFLAVDPSKTPKAYASTQAVRDRLSNLTKIFNAKFLSGIEGTNALVIDSNRITSALLADPVRFGFANINHQTDYAMLHSTLAADLGFPPAFLTVGGASLLLVQDENLFVDGNQYIFADSVHPSPRTHKIIADTVYSVMKAPGFMATIPNAAMANSLQFMHNINANMYSWQEGNCDQELTCNNKFSLYANYQLNDFKIKSTPDFINPLSSNFMNGAVVGGNYFFSPSILLGAAFNYQNTLGKVSEDRGHYHLNQYSLALYTQGAFYCNWVAYASLIGGYIDINSQRKDQIGVATLKALGNIHGQNWAGELGVRYQYRKGKWMTGPRVSYLYDYIRSNTFTETGDFTALKFKSMHLATSRFTLAWDTEYGSSCDALRPYLQLGYEFHTGTTHFWQDYGMVKYTQVKLENVFSDSFNANAGIKCKVHDHLRVNVQGGYHWYWSNTYVGNFDIGLETNW